MGRSSDNPFPEKGTGQPDMLKRGAIWLLSLAVLAPVCFGATTILAGDDKERRGRERPDVVLIVTDDQRWDTLSQMPGVRRLLGEEGLTFSNAFVTNSLCCPSRSSILTGAHSHSTGVYTNGGEHGFKAFDDRSTIATWLNDDGYETAFIGKYFNGSWPGTYVPPGWDRWVAFRNANDLYYDYDLLIDGQSRAYGSDAGSYSTHVLGRYADRFIRKTPAGDPLFLMLSTFAPHSPRTAPPGEAPDPGSGWQPGPNLPEADVSDKPAYIKALSGDAHRRTLDGLRRWAEQVATLQAVDEMVVRVVDALEQTGRLDDTLIVFTSDNGIAFGEHGWTYKLTPYEESIRVPLVMRYDPLTDGASTDALAANVDIAPTIAALTGAPSPGAEGRSLLPILEGTAAGVREDLLIEHVEYRSSNGRPDPPTYCAVRTRNRLFVHYVTGEEELYDLDRDPWQLRNLASGPRHREELTSLRRRTKHLCRPKPPGFTWG
jgi:N-acetylglucosamine-6-sulfatase